MTALMWVLGGSYAAGLAWLAAAVAIGRTWAERDGKRHERNEEAS